MSISPLSGIDFAVSWTAGLQGMGVRDPALPGGVRSKTPVVSIQETKQKSCLLSTADFLFKMAKKHSVKT